MKKQKRRQKGPKRPKRRQEKTPTAYYIERKDLQGDTRYFCDEEDRRIFFTRIRHASWVRKTFLPEQKPKIRRLPIGPGDVDFESLIEQYRHLLSGEEAQQETQMEV